MEIRYIDLAKHLHIHIYSTRKEKDSFDISELRDQLDQEGIASRAVRKNPISQNVWSLIVDLTKDHTSLGLIAAVLIAYFKKHPKARAEIQKGDLKASAADAQQLESVLSSLARYERLTISEHKTELTEHRQHE